MSNTNPDPDFNPYSAPAVVAEASQPQLLIQLEQYRTVRFGLQLIYYSIAAVAILMILLVVSTAIGFGGVTLIFTIVSGMGIFVAALVSIVGFCMCAACPNPNEKTLAFSSILCLMINVAGTLLSNLMPVFAVNETLLIFSGVASAVGSIANFAGSILFCLLLKRIGSNISSDSLKRNSQRALIWFLVLIGIIIFFVVGTSLFGAIGRGWVGAEALLVIFGLTLIVSGLITFFKFLSMLRTGIDELKLNRHAQT